MLLVSGMVWSLIGLASPVNAQQNPTPQSGKEIKDSLMPGGKTLSAANPDPYGFKPLLASNSSLVRANAVTNEDVRSSRTLVYTEEAHTLAPGLENEYLKTDKEKLTHMKTWGVPYFDRIDKIMADHALPTELKYLAVIESELKNSATSRVGAKGFWQFMPETARLYGLTVNRHKDERTDLDKSTRAAARYLQDLYDELHDWLLVIAAYDGGTARIHYAIRKAGSKDFWDLQYYLPAECRNHVKRFIATNFFMADVPPGEHLLPGGEKELEADLTEADLANTTVKAISGHYTATAMAKHLGMPLAEFIRLNPNFDGQVAGAAECYNLRLPKDKMYLFTADQAIILNESVRGLLNDDDDEQDTTHKK
jgi:membrane-bound lytic murein transglycosylase D